MAPHTLDRRFRASWPLDLNRGTLRVNFRCRKDSRTRLGGSRPRGVAIGGRPPECRLTVEKKKTLIEQFKVHEGDTGSPEVQIALLSERINGLTDHFKPTRRTTTPAAAC